MQYLSFLESKGRVGILRNKTYSPHIPPNPNKFFIIPCPLFSQFYPLGCVYERVYPTQIENKIIEFKFSLTYRQLERSTDIYLHPDTTTT
jgi:hypothetical protein